MMRWGGIGLAACVALVLVGSARSSETSRAWTSPPRSMERAGGASAVPAARKQEFLRLPPLRVPVWYGETQDQAMSQVRMVFDGDSVVWGEALEMISCPRERMPDSPQKTKAALLRIRAERCAIHDSLVAQDERSVLYTLSAPGCNPDYPDERSVTRILLGKASAFVLIYTCRSDSAWQTSRERWIRLLAQAEIRTE